MKDKFQVYRVLKEPSSGSELASEFEHRKLLRLPKKIKDIRFNLLEAPWLHYICQLLLSIVLAFKIGDFKLARDVHVQKKLVYIHSYEIIIFSNA